MKRHASTESCTHLLIVLTYVRVLVAVKICKMGIGSTKVIDTYAFELAILSEHVTSVCLEN